MSDPAGEKGKPKQSSEINCKEAIGTTKADKVLASRLGFVMDSIR